MYVVGVYNGTIWVDEYILGAIGKMFNIRISMISPFFNDIWNLFRDGKKSPDVILICNSVSFGHGLNHITHISSTRGNGESWKCIGADTGDKNLEYFSGYSEGKMAILDYQKITYTATILSKSQQMLKDINQLCYNVKNICANRDEVLANMKGLKITLGHFKRLTSYFTVKDEEHTSTRTTMPATTCKTKIFPSVTRAIPTIRVKDCRQSQVGLEILKELTEGMAANMSFSEFEQPTQYDVAAVHSQCSSQQEQTSKQRNSTHQHCQIKVAGAQAPFTDSTHPALLSLGKYQRMIKTPQKKTKPKTREYTASRPKEQLDKNIEEYEKGEIIENDSTSNNNNLSTEENEAQNIEIESEHTDDDNLLIVDDDLENIVKIPDELQLIEANEVTETFNKNTTSNIGEKSFEDILEDFENDNENDKNLSRIMDQAPLNMSMDQQIR